jgi:hypothetical protein
MDVGPWHKTLLSALYRRTSHGPAQLVKSVIIPGHYLFLDSFFKSEYGYAIKSNIEPRGSWGKPG